MPVLSPFLGSVLLHADFILGLLLCKQDGYHQFQDQFSGKALSEVSTKSHCIPLALIGSILEPNLWPGKCNALIGQA